MSAQHQRDIDYRRLRSWIIQRGYWKLLDAKKKASVEREHEVGNFQEADEPGEILLPPPERSRPSTSFIMDAERLVELARADDPVRVTIALARVLRGDTYQELAKHFGRPLKTVARWGKEGEAILRAHLEPLLHHAARQETPPSVVTVTKKEESEQGFVLPPPLTQTSPLRRNRFATTRARFRAEEVPGKLWVTVNGTTSVQDAHGEDDGEGVSVAVVVTQIQSEGEYLVVRASSVTYGSSFDWTAHIEADSLKSPPGRFRFHIIHAEMSPRCLEAVLVEAIESRPPVTKLIDGLKTPPATYGPGCDAC